uniref:AIR synthase related protein, N-terminal domain n=1 Tax=Candidatus Kentrum sp. FM TaxID=2126340 RepID=A0A450S423_9GAMM|nr:MAG: AIR synthase related protein, N-terminal domain [Candidatus Kentron sp. FM]VFJ46547.1 MAG: AIR synthase related protein, N-terminal domain [Candidatus Kentron sp. FM]VFK06362.1 MAG: AIR synthase related protein, N-terminal domain [Candidatus Kentron sp. FM]
MNDARISLAIHGTANDLAVVGAKPLYFTLNALLEEGLAIHLLDRIVASGADLLVLTKTDLLPHLDDFDPRQAENHLRVFANTAPVFPLSARSRAGSGGWGGMR